MGKREWESKQQKESRKKKDFVRNTTEERREKRREVIKSALIIKKKELSSFIRKFRRDKVQSQIRRFARIFDIFQVVVPLKGFEPN
jgi:hypothetical protein